MSLITKLVNPTPFDVEIPYEKGISIMIPADGEVDLSMQQLYDFLPGKPGSEETRKLLNFEGVFLSDSDLSYDFQALQTLKSCVRERMDRINTFVDRTKNSRLAGGAAVDEASMKEVKESSGYARMEENANKLVARIKILEKIVNADENKGTVRQNLDPERTCFAMNPPRQFPSKTALAMYLSENPETAAKHEALINPVEDDTPVHVPGPVGGRVASGFRSADSEGEFNG